MPYALRPYATAGVALVGASIIAVTPVAVPLPNVQARAVTLVDAWSDLITETTTNWQNIIDGADTSAITSVLSQLATNPLGVLDALSNVTPSVTSDLGTLPGTITIQLPPALELAIAELGKSVTTFNALGDVVTQLQSDPSSAYEGLATILNGYLNGQDNISLLDGAINIAGFNGILAPAQDVSISLNLPDLLDALGVGNLSLSSLGVNLTDLLSQLGLGKLDLGGLLSALNISDDGLGTLLGNPTLSGLLGDLGLSGLGLGSLNLTDILSNLGLDSNVNLNDLGLDTVLNAFGIDTASVTGGLTGLLSAVGLGSLNSESLGSLVALLPTSTLDSALGSLNGVLGTLLDPLLSLPVLGPLLTTALSNAGLNLDSLLTVGNLETALDGITVGQLLGGQSFDTTVGDLLGGLGVTVPGDDLTIGGILEALGFSSSTADLTLGGLLGDLNIGGDGIGDLLNTVSLGDLIGDLGLSSLPLNLSDLGNLTDLTVGGLLGDLGLGDIATVNVDGFGGLLTELVDVIPQQILASLSG